MYELSRFICYNVDWIQSSLSVGPSVSASPNESAGANIMPALIKPWGSEILPPSSPFDMMNTIGASAAGGGIGVVGSVGGRSMVDSQGPDAVGGGAGVASGLTMGYNRLEGVVTLLIVDHYFSIGSKQLLLLNLNSFTLFTCLSTLIKSSRSRALVQFQQLGYFRELL